MKIKSGIDLFNEINAQCLAVSDRLLIASPYIGSKNFVSNALGNKWHSNPKIKFSILVDYSNKGNCDPKTLRYILENGAKIKSLKALHAKIYIFDDELILTSANLTETAFKRRYEIGASLDKNESKDFIDYFNDIWKKGKFINTKDLMSEKLFKRKYGRSNDDNSNNFPVLFDIKIPKIQSQTIWFRISGYSEEENRDDSLDISELLNRGFIHTKKGRSGGGKPGFKESEIVVLSRMGMRKGINDHYIYGKAKVDIPYRDDKDNQLNYIKYISKNKNYSDKIKKDIISKIERWPFGVWLKDYELIKGNNSKFIWIGELKNEKGNNLINPNSLSRQSHIIINSDQFRLINIELEKRFKKYGKKTNKKPENNWINEFITNKKNWSTR